MTKKRLVCVLGLIALLLAGLIAPAFLLPKTKVTRENFRKLEIGMTQLQVAELFGEEPEEWMYIGSDFGLIHKLWEGEGIATIRFERNGGLRTKCWSEPGFASSTKESFDRIENGMTFAQVAVIFGRKHDHWYGTTYMWNDIDGSGGMTIGAGGVEQKWWSGGAPEFRVDRGFIPAVLRWINFR